jgi:hypothetical protein
MSPPDSPQPIGVDRAVIKQAMCITETIANLTYLVTVGADDPGKVRFYANHAEERIQALSTLLQSLDTDPPYVP